MAQPPTQRDFVGYGETPPEFRWPGNARVAVSLVINVEEGAERSIARGDKADDLAAHWIPAQPAAVRNVALESAFEYGSRAGIWRLLRILRKHRVQATAFCCAAALQLNPPIAAALVRDGHEIADHGHQWDTHTELDDDAEQRLIVASRDAIKESTGHVPTSWYSRDGLKPGTRQVLATNGFSYESNSFNDDLPHWGSGQGNPRLPVLPYAGDTNDSGLFKQFPTATAFGNHLTAALDMLLEDPRGGPSVMSVGLHPRLIGRPAYAVALERFISHARQKDAWFATRMDIVNAWLDVTAGGADDR
ncbi:peptidoglycan/xylan/chitin deacetylase (PgdA/CDA1 family) [Arthrobacter sp. 1088]|uniref:polysaccharide deacetylase family protein n=1 Tax=Arthrobacter sp. 1088 TaxID=2817768 RepID=UPI002859FCE3|nr:polysaccharide deacetylase family protein [Arthrobacter sp. 1088]MDR6688413.1 peptidoglycan/xylan/chitin deacetylase (PgdA/CDA1 family) [Arthrobacter sp. 1088]